MDARHAAPGTTRPRLQAASRFCCALLALLALARPGVASAATLDLIPPPRSISTSGAARSFAPACEVRSDSAGDDVYALRVLRALVATRRHAGPRAAATLSRVELRASVPTPLPDRAIASQSYTLEVRVDRVVITGATREARLHGVETLRQLLSIGHGALRTGRVVDGPSLAVRGLSLDVSRGRIPTLADLVSTLDVCASYKLNVFQLYLEDTFDYSRVPAGARADDTLDPLTLRRVAAEARLRGIQFIPIVQTLAHQERLLSRPGMRHHAECDGSSMFAITRPATRELVRSMVDDVLAASGSRAVHLGCDEAADLGRGASRARVKRDGVESLFCEHVRDLAQRARAGSNAGSWIYADALRAHPELATLLPRDLVLVDWDYDAGSTFASLDTLAAAGLDRVVTSPGLWDWCTVYPDQARAHANIETATRAARAHGCLGSVLASWGDGGGECLFGNAAFGIAWFAECAWAAEPGPRSPTSDPDAFLARYCRLRFGTSAAAVHEALQALQQLALPGGAYGERMLYRPILVRERTPAWRDAMAGIAAAMTRARTALASTAADAGSGDAYASAELESLRASSGRLLAAAERELALDSLATAIDAAPSGDAAAQARAAQTLGRIAAAEAAAQAVYARAWRAHNRETGLSVLEARFAAQSASLDSLRACAARRELRAYESQRALSAREVHGQTRRSTAGSARSAPRMNTVSGRTAGIQ